MKKPFFIFILLLSYPIFSKETLKETIKEELFNSKKWSRQKPILEHYLINNLLPQDLLDFTEITLKDIDLSGMVLYNINFKRCKFININLKNVDLSHTTFYKIVFNSIDFTDTCLKNISFPKCKFYKVDLRNVDLRQTDFKDARFEKAKLGGARLSERLIFNDQLSDFSLVQQYAKFFKQGKIDKCKGLNKITGPLQLKLVGKNLDELDLTKINLENACLSFSSLHKTNLTNAHLKNANLSKANLRKSNLIGTDLKDSNLAGAFLQEAWLSENFRICNYKSSKQLFNTWYQAKEEEKQFYQKLINAQVHLFFAASYHQLQQVNWQKISLRNANLKDTHLYNMDLSNIDSTKASIFYTNLCNTKLTGARLAKIKLFKTLIFPSHFTTKELSNIYNACSDIRIKFQLKQILIAIKI